jgi:hypothetical protein
VRFHAVGFVIEDKSPARKRIFWHAVRHSASPKKCTRLSNAPTCAAKNCSRRCLAAPSILKFGIASQAPALQVVKHRFYTYGRASGFRASGFSDHAQISDLTFLRRCPPALAGWSPARSHGGLSVCSPAGRPLSSLARLPRPGSTARAAAFRSPAARAFYSRGIA